MGVSREEILSNKGCFEKNHGLCSLIVANLVRMGILFFFTVICIAMNTNEDDYLFLCL